MGSEDCLDSLLEGMMEESSASRPEVPGSIEGKRLLLRSYMNVRPPMPMDPGLASLQDEYLRQRNLERGRTRLEDIPTVDVSLDSGIPCADRISLWKGDITTLECDAIVNAANSRMLGCLQPLHLCIDNCIHTFAGIQLRMECHRRMTELRSVYGEGYEQPVAVPMVTDAYNLPCRKVVHVVGPMVCDVLEESHERMLAQCYSNVLEACRDEGIGSVAFCCISAGAFRFPGRRAAEIAVKTVVDWLSDDDSVERVVFDVFSDEDLQTYERLLSQERGRRPGRMSGDVLDGKHPYLRTPISPHGRREDNRQAHHRPSRPHGTVREPHRARLRHEGGHGVRIP
jgi:O-acetyl-ADP-ribose deacetylase (regulator of RNase III)